jgi:type I restriction enzyme S subunit
MKDSGVEWLGEVPEHWSVKPIKFLKSSGPNSFVDGPFGSNLKSEHFIQYGDVYVIESNFATQGKLSPDDLKTISYEHFKSISRSEVRAGDIVIAKIGAQFGKCSILPVLDKLAVISGNSLKLTLNEEICSQVWGYWQFVNLKNIGAIDDLAKGGAQPALSLGDLNSMKILVPPKEEQENILLNLSQRLVRYDSIVAATERSIELLKERRTSLITALVTGQINILAFVNDCV